MPAFRRLTPEKRLEILMDVQEEADELAGILV